MGKASLGVLLASGLAACNGDPAGAWAGEFTGSSQVSRSSTDTSSGSPTTTSDNITHPDIVRVFGSATTGGGIVLLFEGDTCELVFAISGSTATLVNGTECNYPVNDRLTHTASGSPTSVSTDVGSDTRTYTKGAIQLGANDAIEVNLSATFTTSDTYTGSSGTPSVSMSSGSYDLTFKGQRL